MTGWRFTSSMPAITRSLSSCFEVTRMWRKTDRANLEKKSSMRLSHEPCLGVKVNSKRPGGRASSQALDGFARLGGGFFQNLDLAINAQNLRHLLLELGIATFQIVAHLVRLDFLLAEDLAHRALNQLGETFVPRRRSVLACVTCQKPRRPQLMRIAVLLGLVARQRHQPGFGLRCDDRFFARPWPILDRRQPPIAQRPLHAALNRLMVNPNSLPHRTERRILAIGQQHPRPRYPARRL